MIVYMTAEPRSGFTTQQMLDAAGAQGTPATKRLLYDWTGQGLLDHPARPGLGRKAGWGTSWPESQMKLWLVLLEKRRTVKRIDTLWNVPVIMWLMWGDDYVPLRQARTALGSWGARWETSPSKKRAYQSARQLVADVGVPGVWSKARQMAIDVIAEAGISGELDRARLVSALAKVMDPTQTGEPRGTLMKLSPEGVVTLIEARLTAIRGMTGLEDETFYWARYLWAAGLTGYVADQPTLATDVEVGHFAKEMTIHDVGSNACLQLLTVLGCVILGSRPGAEQGGFFDPARSPLAGEPRYMAVRISEGGTLLPG